MLKILISILLIFSFSSCEKEKISNEEKEESKNIFLALGDSITAGYNLEISKSYPSKLEQKLNQNGYNYKIINGGVSGDTSANLLSRSELYLDLNPEIVLIVIGGNDGLQGLELNQMKENIISIIDIFDDSKIILGGMDLPKNLSENYIKNFKNVYKEIYQEKKSEGKNIFFIENFLENVAGKREFNLNDLIHPNEKGYEIISSDVFEFLEENKIIKK